jgi:hypothetical protein
MISYSLLVSLCDFIEENNLKEEALNYVATCDEKELKEVFER